MQIRKSLNESVQTLEEKDFVSYGTVKSLNGDEVAEIEEIDKRRLNLIRLNMPESKKKTSARRQLEDKDFLTNVMENKITWIQLNSKFSIL